MNKTQKALCERINRARQLELELNQTGEGPFLVLPGERADEYEIISHTKGPFWSSAAVDAALRKVGYESAAFHDAQSLLKAAKAYEAMADIVQANSDPEDS